MSHVSHLSRSTRVTIRYGRRRDDSIDVVTIVTPNNSHYEIAKAFLEAGIDVICDKPLTTDLDQALDLLRMQRERGLVFGVTYN